MLGSIIRPRPWHWAAIGKHPAAKDYIRVGDASPLIEALADWAAKGYQHLGPAKAPAPDHHSWRFWLQGVKKGEIVCGLGRDSSDRIGRPFPLLVLGEGPLKGWEKKWTQLPQWLDKTWQRLEHVASRRYDQLSVMEEALAALASPELPAGDGMAQASGASGCNMDQFRRQLNDEGFGLVPLNHDSDEDTEPLVHQCHRHLQAHCRQMPRAVFMGGNPHKTYLAAIGHPLGRSDFVRLWTL